MDGGSWHCTGGSDQDNPQGKKKKSKKAKWLSEAALQIAEKRREAKSKGKKKRYAHLNARRHKKAFLDDQCKEIEENKNVKD